MSILSKKIAFLRRPLLLLLLLTTTKTCVLGASNGAKNQACEDMFPNHNVPKQTGNPPYFITVSKTTFSCGENVFVELKANDLEGFKGFLCQMRSQWDKYITYGSLISAGPVSMLTNCGQAASLTQSDPSIKHSASFVWSAPKTNIGHVIFVCTVVKNYMTFWLNVTSPVIYVDGPCDLETSTAVSNTASSVSLTSMEMSSTDSTVNVSSYSTTLPSSLSTSTLTSFSNSKSSSVFSSISSSKSSSTSLSTSSTKQTVTTTYDMIVNKARSLSLNKVLLLYTNILTIASMMFQGGSFLV